MTLKSQKPSANNMKPNPLSLHALWPSFERSMRAENRAESTLHAYRDCLKSVERWARVSGNALTLESLDRAALEELFISLRDRLATTTLRVRYAQISHFFGWVVDSELLDDSPMRRMRPVKADEPPPPPVLTIEQMRAILKQCEGKGFYERRDMAMFRLLFDTGMRRSELLSLTVSGIDWETQTVQVAAKRKARVVPFGDKAARDLDRYLLTRARHTYAQLDALWIGRHGAISYGGIYAILKSRAAGAGIERFWPHVGRHTAADQWLEAEGQEGDLMELMGWSSRTMLGVYGRGRKAARARAAHKRLSLGDKL